MGKGASLKLIRGGNFGILGASNFVREISNPQKYLFRFLKNIWRKLQFSPKPFIPLLRALGKTLFFFLSQKKQQKEEEGKKAILLAHMCHNFGVF